MPKSMPKYLFNKRKYSKTYHKTHYKKNRKTITKVKMYKNNSIIGGGISGGGSSGGGSSGGGSSGGLINLAIREHVDKYSALPFGLNKFNPASYLQTSKINPNTYRIVYNYRSQYQNDIKQNDILVSSNVVNKPHLFMPDMNQYLISLVENPNTQKSRLLWLASYKNRSWEHDILSYIPPLPKQGQTRLYAFFIYKYPLEIIGGTNIYKPLEMTNAKRGEEFIKFQIYLTVNKNIQLIPNLTKFFSVKYDSGNVQSFLSNVFIGKKTHSRDRNRVGSSIRTNTRLNKLMKIK